MLDHILGKPSANIRRAQALLTALAALAVVRRRKQAPWGLQWLARWDRRVSMWKALVAWSTVLYLLRHMDDLLGLNAPEPLREYYSRSFYRATWIFTALDAGFWTAMSVRPKPLRDVLSLVFSLYYLVFTNRGVDKVRKVRALITIDHLRVSWNKGVDNPLLRLVRWMHSSRLGVRRRVILPADTGSGSSSDSESRLSDIAELEPAQCHIMYSGAEDAYSQCGHVVLNYPGGGFVSMGPECHSDYLSAWAEKTQAVVVSVDYAKAPEYPYPYAIDQCYEVYRELVQTNGRCIGLDLPEQQPLRIVLAGDSAGGNITAGVMFRILESPDKLPSPDGIVFIYGCFNVDIRAWMTRDETRTLLGIEEASSGGLQKTLSSLADQRDHLHHISPLAVTNNDDGYQQRRFRRQPPVYLDDRVRVVRSTGEVESTGVGYLPLTMTSSFTYFNDQVLSPEMMRAMVLMYVGPNRRPNFRTDYYLSPIVAPDHLLARFPPVYFMCGEKDPMVDDTVLFAARIRQAKKQQRGAMASGKAGPGPTQQQQPQAGSGDGASGEYREYRTSALYSRRHSQPRIRPGGSSSTQFYIGSTDVSDNEDAGEAGTRANMPAFLRMSQFPAQAKAQRSGQRRQPVMADSEAVIKVKLVAGMSHGFMQMYSLLPESKRVASILGDWLSELLYGDHTITAYSRCASAVDQTRDKHTEPLTDDDDHNDQADVEWAVGQRVAAQLKRRNGRVQTTDSPTASDTTAVEEAGGGAEKASIFDKGLVDRHGIEVVSAANMVRRRGHGLADPLH